MPRLAGLEGLRGIAATAVLVFHVWLYQTQSGHLPLGHHLDGFLSHLWLGVTLFFILSGFLLYRPFVRASLHARKDVDLARYARARFLRIVPAYWTALTLIILWTHPEYFVSAVTFFALGCMCLGAYCYRSADRRITRLASLATVFTCGTWALVMATSAMSNRSLDAPLVDVFWNYLMLNTQQSEWFFVPAWTLAIEASFYVCLPFIARLAAWMSRKASSPRKRAALQAPLLLALTALALVYQALNHYYHLPLLLPGYTDLFALGMALATLYELNPTPAVMGRRTHVIIVVAAAVTFVVATAIEHGGIVSILYGPLVGVSIALAVSSVVFRPTTRAHRILSSRPLVALGSVSYGLYIWHWTIIDQLYEGDLSTWRPASFPITIFLVFALAVAAASVSWLVVERRALRLKNVPLTLWIGWLGGAADAATNQTQAVSGIDRSPVLPAQPT